MACPLRFTQGPVLQVLRLVNGRYNGTLPENVPLKKLVAKPLVFFAKLLGKDYLPVHEANKYHKEAMQTGKDFLVCVCAPEKDVANQICIQHLHQVNDNRSRWFAIIKSVIFLGRQNKNILSGQIRPH